MVYRAESWASVMCEKSMSDVDTWSLAMRSALRIAQLYGYLVARTDRLYHPGGMEAVCSLYTAQEMVKAGWLVIREGRYVITPEGRRFESGD
jgi:ribosomal protein S19E (S16A)